MDDSEIKLKGGDWFKRWEAMMNTYIPRRVERFDVMLEWADLPRRRPARILDLGCGPGSLAFRAARAYPRARLVAVDFDPILLAIGRRQNEKEDGRVTFMQADLRQPGIWKTLADQPFDLLISATALHWLAQKSLAQLYRRLPKVMRPGAWLLNADHVAGDDPAIQRRYRQVLDEKKRRAFEGSRACAWDAFWKKLADANPRLDVAGLSNSDTHWEGSDDGLPKSFHMGSLKRCGFENVDIYWQDLGEAIIGARWPGHIDSNQD